MTRTQARHQKNPGKSLKITPNGFSINFDPPQNIGKLMTPDLRHGQARRVLLGMGNLPPLMTESLFHGYSSTPTDLG